MCQTATTSSPASQALPPPGGSVLPPGALGSDHGILRTDTGSRVVDVNVKGRLRVSEGDPYYKDLGPPRPAQVPGPEDQVCIRKGDGVAREGSALQCPHLGLEAEDGD